MYKLKYIKFKPTLFKEINGRSIKVDIAMGPDDQYHEVLTVVDDPAPAHPPPPVGAVPAAGPGVQGINPLNA